MSDKHPRSRLRTIRPVTVSLLAGLLVMACDDGNTPTAPAPPVTSTVKGTVISGHTGIPVAGAEVRIGAVGDTTGADGSFEITGLSTGTAVLRVTSTSFLDFEGGIILRPGSNEAHIGLTRMEVFEFGNFALYVPAGVSAVRGIILALGGPDTRGFATGKPLGAPLPAVEASLQALGQSFRDQALVRGLAILGTSQAAMPNAIASDAVLEGALKTGATLSARPELPIAPLLMYGISGGAPQSSGFTARNPQRVAGLFLKVPSAVSSITGGAALGVPTYMVQAELDAFVNNGTLTTAFETNRRAGALWGLAKEMAVVHHSLTPAQRQLTINWMNTILDVRLPSSGVGPLRDIAETSGWLGNRVTGEAGSWANFTGDRSLASWLPSQATATEWQSFVAAPNASANLQ